MAPQSEEVRMKRWTMTIQDFRHMLEVEQEFKCPITGYELTPQTITIAHKTPLKKGGKHILANVHLIHSAVAKLAKEHTLEELLAISQDIVRQMKIGSLNDK